MGSFESYADALLRHHLLLSAGTEDGPEMKQVEDLLSQLWDKLDDTQQQEMRGVSSDLNWIRRGYVQAPKARTREEITPDELREFYRLYEAQDFSRLLPIVRMCASALPNSFVAFVRAKCYSGLGLRAIGNLYLRRPSTWVALTCVWLIPVQPPNEKIS